MYNARRRFNQNYSRTYRLSSYRPRSSVAALGSRSVRKSAKYATGRQQLPKFAVTGYSKDTEKKYRDKCIISTGFQGLLPGSVTTNGGFGMTSTGWTLTVPVNSTGPPTAEVTAQDFLRGVSQGTTVNQRIGNKITVKYVKGNITMQANQIINYTNNAANAQNGESRTNVPGSDGTGVLDQYLRTTYRLVIVKDLQINSTATSCAWNDVFETSDSSGTGGVHSELKIASMGRYRILSDKLYNLDADDPQKTVPFMLRNVGPVRYNGPNADGLASQSIYIIWACWTHGVNRSLPEGRGLNGGSVIANSRMCFTDA